MSKSGWSTGGDATPVRNEKEDGGGSMEEAGGEEKEPPERVKVLACHPPGADLV